MSQNDTLTAEAVCDSPGCNVPEKIEAIDSRLDLGDKKFDQMAHDISQLFQLVGNLNNSVNKLTENTSEMSQSIGSFTTLLENIVKESWGFIKALLIILLTLGGFKIAASEAPKLIDIFSKLIQ